MGLNEIALGLTLGIAVFTDWRDHKIYNKLLFPAFFIALLLHTFQGGVSGLISSLMGAVIGLVILLLPYFMGAMGAGDVKFLAVIGAFGGVSFVITSILYGAVIGGIISAFLLARRKALGNTLKYFLLFIPVFKKTTNFSEALNDARKEKFPYGIAIGLGTLIALFLPQGGGWS